MASLTGTEVAAIAIVVILAVVVIGVLLYMLRRLRERRAKLLGELQDRPQLIQDRAFNRIAMARRESELLARQGRDTSRPSELIAQAQGAFDVRNYDGAYQYAQQAHEALVHSRTDRVRLPTGGTPAVARNSSGLGPTGIPAGRSLPSSAGEPPVPAPAIPKNRAESQFQIHLLDQEIEAARAKPASAASVRDAAKFRGDAQSAFDRSDFTEAFRLALKGRRAIGANVESLPALGVAASPSDGPNGGRANLDADQAAEAAADADRCSRCGYPALPGDTFCRGCGQPRAEATCLKCGAPRQSSDTFCGRCGASFS
jgi:hypothetical protein